MKAELLKKIQELSSLGYYADHKSICDAAHQLLQDNLRLRKAIEEHRESMKLHGPSEPSPIDQKLYNALEGKE